MYIYIEIYTDIIYIYTYNLIHILKHIYIYTYTYMYIYNEVMCKDIYIHYESELQYFNQPPNSLSKFANLGVLFRSCDMAMFDSPIVIF